MLSSKWKYLLPAGALLVGFTAAIVFRDYLGPALNWVAIVSAGWLGYASLEKTAFAAEQAREQAAQAKEQARQGRAQVELTRRALELSYQPLLEPVHDAAEARVRLGDVKDTSYPAEDSFKVVERTEFERVFRVAGLGGGGRDRLSEAMVVLHNVGQGPATIGGIRIVSSSGLVGQLSGSRSIAPGGYETFIGELRKSDGAASLDEIASDWGKASPIELWRELRKRDPRRLFFLEVEYDDVFKSPGVRKLRAWFDWRGRGRWVVHTDLVLAVD